MSSEKVQIPSNRPPLVLECLEERIAPAGNIIAVVSGGNLTITGDADANEFSIETWLDLESLLITPTSGTTINGGANPLALTGITGGIRMNLGDGNDSVSFHGIEVAKNLQINAGAGGADSVTVDSLSTIGGSLTLSDTEHADFVDLNVTRNVAITYTTDGQKIVDMTAGHVGGNVSITNRGQDMLSHFSLDGADIVGRLTVSNKTGTHGFGDANTLSIHDSLVGGVKVKGGTGDYDFSFVDSQTFPGKGGISLSYGVGDVTALIDNSTVYGSVSLKTAGGLAAMAYDTHVTLQNNSVVHGKLNVRTFDTTDVVTLDDVYVVEGMNINTGTGSSVVTINESVIGVDLLGAKPKAYASTISQTANGWSLDADNTTVNVTTTEIGQLNLKLRPQDATVGFDKVRIYSNLSVSTQGGDDFLCFHSLNALGNVAIKTSSGHDCVYFDNAQLERTLSIDAGTGDDSVLMDSGFEDALSMYHGPVKILLGAGDDFLRMGTHVASCNWGVYEKPVLLNGGPGADELVYLAAGNVFAKAPKIVLFENVG